jgi:hypothetical protein
MRREERAETRQQLGHDNALWRESGQLSSILKQLNKPDASVGNFRYASMLLLNRFFGRHQGKVLDVRERCLWAVDMDQVSLPYLKHGIRSNTNSASHERSFYRRRQNTNSANKRLQLDHQEPFPWEVFSLSSGHPPTPG